MTPDQIRSMTGEEFWSYVSAKQGTPRIIDCCSGEEVRRGEPFDFHDLGLQTLVRFEEVIVRPDGIGIYGVFVNAVGDETRVPCPFAYNHPKLPGLTLFVPT